MLAGIELNTEQLVDTTFWLKPWLKSISFGSIFFFLTKVLATTNSEPGYLPVFCYSQCGEHSESLHWLYKALQEDDQYVDALVSVSAALIKLGNLTEAAKHLNRAEQISPESKDVYNHYGLLMEKKGKHLI